MTLTSDLDPAAGGRLAERPRRRRWLTVLLVLTVFGSGLVIGAGGALLHVRNQVLRAVHHPDEVPARIAAHLERKLGLSAEQTRQVEDILRARQNELQAIRREVQPRVVDELDQAEHEIAAVLDDHQRQEWHDLFTRLRDTWLPPAPQGRIGVRNKRQEATTE